MDSYRRWRVGKATFRPCPGTALCLHLARHTPLHTLMPSPTPVQLSGESRARACLARGRHSIPGGNGAPNHLP